MNSLKVFQRMRWNFLIAISFALTIAIFAVGVAYAATTVGMNDDPPDAFPQSPLDLGDWGDLPEIGGNRFIVQSPFGAMHRASELRLGIYKDQEDTPLPSAFADGDDISPPSGPDDEDGVTRDENYLWDINETVWLTVTVNGCASAPCYLNGWIDWNGNNNFEIPGDQIFENRAVTNGVNNLDLVIPGTYTLGSSVFAHFRLCSSVGVPTEISDIGCNALRFYSEDGEVEDYYWTFGPTAVELVSLEANTNYAVPFALLAGALILLFSGGVILAFKRNQA